MSGTDESMLTAHDVRDRLSAATVTIVGCGGLGSNVAAMLLRSGVRTLTLVDHDRVEPGNLDRQMFFADQVGRAKVEALAETLRRIDADACLTLVCERVTADNAVEIVGAPDVLVEAVDGADTKAMLLDVCTRDLPGVAIVTASGMAGTAPADEIVTERLARDVYVVGDLTAGIADGRPLLASRVMVAAAHEAHAVVRLLLGLEP